ncbi:MAG: diguanylate cyclase [Ruegeria sp.]|uniref:diguanylate cyclase domain-containing protein n=1 Tax=Ruegeria sp. TaxID=1879320 RepID=UPI00349E641A
MQGTILVLDGVSTNRIMLKVQLTSAWYRVAQGDRVDGLLPLLRRVRPDLVLTAMTLPDGGALDVRALMQTDETLADIPVVAVAPQNDRAARLRALAAGLDEVLVQPYDDVLLLARIRSLIRSHANTEELRAQGGPQALGFAEPAAGLLAPAPAASVALVTRKSGTGAVWRSKLRTLTLHRLNIHRLDDIQSLLTEPVPDAIVMELGAGGKGLNLLADLRARSATRHAAVIAVPEPSNPNLAAEALDRGADDVMPAGFCADELALRLDTQLARKVRSDGYRASVRDGWRAALTDPMTGLHNRRYAMPALQRIAASARDRGESFAVMLADLDHFKRINDQYGHPAGDAVLIETARRLRKALRPSDIVARVGGEEFMIVLPDTGRRKAQRMADDLCQRINGQSFALPGCGKPIPVTTSIGLLVSEPGAITLQGAEDVSGLIEQADRALYVAKGAGRNQVSMIQSAA